MEEIIASISRMLAEDGKSAPLPQQAEQDEDILELTEAVDEEGRVRPIRGPAEASTRGTLGAPDEPTEPIVRFGSKGLRSLAVGDPAPDAGPILSPEAAETAATAFGELAAAGEARRAAEAPSIGTAGRTLEELVHESLRPLLREWLDRHLPAIVERLVREEIARIASAARPR